MAHAVSGTLVASTVATVNLDQPYNRITVVNEDNTAVIFFRIDGTNPSESSGVGGNDSYAVNPHTTVTIPGLEGGPTSTNANAQVRLISHGTPAYTVEGF